MTDQAAARKRRSARRWWIGVLVVMVVVGVVVVLGANRPADPYLAGDPGTVGPGTAGPGTGDPGNLAGEFRSVSFTVTGAGTGLAPIAERCAFLAETADEQARGLMNTTDLEGRDGMIFRFADDVTTAFYMKDTPMPLSIAWFDADGAFVSATDMEPCLGQPDCPTYAPEAPYRYALEVPRGRLPEVGAVPGSRLTVGGPCG